MQISVILYDNAVISGIKFNNLCISRLLLYSVKFLRKTLRIEKLEPI